MSAPTVIALDDWMIFARDASGEIVFAVSECWPEWLDFPTAPEDMDDEDFKRSSLDILKRKQPQWRNYAQWFLDGERDFARARGLAFDEAEAATEVAQALASITELAEKQRAYITPTAGSLGMTAPHTPGPWEVRSLAPNIALQIVGSHIVIAALPTLNSEPWAPANARLIAAAPNMLAELREAQYAASEACAQLFDLAERADTTHAVRDAREAVKHLIASQHRLRAFIGSHA